MVYLSLTLGLYNKLQPSLSLSKVQDLLQSSTYLVSVSCMADCRSHLFRNQRHMLYLKDKNDCTMQQQLQLKIYWSLNKVDVIRINSRTTMKI